LLARRTATVRLDAGGAGAWLVVLRRGRPVTWGRADDTRRGAVRATTTLFGDISTLAALVDGRASGVQAFLDGTVTVRGDLGLALALDGVFLHPNRPDRWARTGLVDVRVGRRAIPTSVISAGRPDAPPVVLLHGLGASAASLLPLVDDLAADHLVHAPDLPGFGDSAKPRAPYDPAFFSRWLIALLDALGHERAVIVGNSLGGRVALEVGLSAPERVRGLVLLCPSSAWRRVRQLVPLARLLRVDLLAGLPWPRPTHRFLVECIRAMFSVPDRLPLPWYEAAADEALRVLRDPAARRAFVCATRQVYLEEADGERGFWTRLATLPVPALFVWGDRDRLVPASFARHVMSALPQADSVVLDDCGHVPQFELPEETAATVRAFLARLPADPR
jgi:pimeloyl-ACP methyl ester carboxylesterase